MRSSIIFIIWVCCLQAISAQDIIVLRDTGEISARVTEIRHQHVMYTAYDEPDSDPIKLAKSKIELIIFQDGMQQFFAFQESDPQARKILMSVDVGDAQAMYVQGSEDAKVYYEKNGPFWGTLGATVFYPIVGVFSGAITGTVIGAVPPSIDMTQLPNPALYRQSPDYAAGYRKQAHKKKIKKVLKGFGIGAAIQAAIIVVVASTW